MKRNKSGNMVNDENNVNMLAELGLTNKRAEELINITQSRRRRIRQ